MIRRLFILIGSLVGVALLTCLLSEVWQFGYVGPSRSVGLRGGTLWHITRSAPMSDPDGFYAGDADDVNLAMRTITSLASWSHHPVWWTVSVPTIAFVYALLVVGGRRFIKRPLPRAVRTTLVAAAALLGLAWIAGQFAILTLDVSTWHFRLQDGNLNYYWDRDGSQAKNYPGRVLSWHRSPQRLLFTFVPQYWPTVRLNRERLVANIPVGVFAVLLGVPACAFLRCDPRNWSGCCKKCRYDLTGNVTGVCPECGTPCVPSEPPQVTRNCNS